MPVVDTLKLKTKLSDSGMPEAQAQVLVEELDGVLSTAIATQVATKTDMVELRAAINADVVELRAAINNLEERFEQRFEGVDQRFEGVDRRFEQIDKRFEQVDKRFEQVDKRLDQIQADMRQMRQWQMGLYVFIALGFLGMIVRDLLLK